MRLQGRHNELKFIDDFIFESPRPILYIFGQRGIGKSTILYEYFLQNQDKIGNRTLRLNGYDFNNIPLNNLGNGTDILIIDDYQSITTDFKLTMAVPTSFLKDVVDNGLFKKIILCSDEEPFLIGSQSSLFGRILTLKISPPSIQELLDNFSPLTDKLNKEDLKEIFEQLNNNPRNIIATLNAVHSYGIDGINELRRIINEPIIQPGLIGLDGNPLNQNSKEFNSIRNQVRIVNNSILNLIEHDPRKIYELSPRNFEELVGELLEKEGFSITITKQTRDGGKDLFIAQNSALGNFLFYVECKKYSMSNPVGVNVVRELYGTITADRATAGLIVTSSYFTKDAIDFTQKIQHQMNLKDYFEICEWVKNIQKTR